MTRPWDMGALRSCINERFPGFKANKLQEMIRLVAEIAKRDALNPEDVLTQIPSGCKAYPAVKSFLVSRRFPGALRRGERVAEVFSAYAVDPACAVELKRPPKIPWPQRIFIETACASSDVALRACRFFPSAPVQYISSYKEYAAVRRLDIQAYNRRAEDLFIVNEKYDFFKPCPCSPGVVPCGYHNVNLGFGCPFECSYCFLQDYTNAPGIVLPANLHDFFDAFRRYKADVRVGSGETTDSLVYDHVTGFAPQIVEFFRTYPKSIFEFKTKSNNIGGLMSVRGASNIVVGFSLNPQDVIDREEHFTASLEERFESAAQCAGRGYRVAFHFDPLIHYPGWELAYEDLVRRMFQAVPPEAIAWISLGSLRMTQSQKKIIENRFPCNTILDGELFTAKDGKLRYADAVRLDIYSKMMRWLKARASRSTFIYLCMEMESIWSNLQGQRQENLR